MKQDISAISREVSQARDSCGDAEGLPIGEAVANVASEQLRSIRMEKRRRSCLACYLIQEEGQQR